MGHRFDYKNIRVPAVGSNVAESLPHGGFAYAARIYILACVWKDIRVTIISFSNYLYVIITLKILHPSLAAPK